MPYALCVPIRVVPAVFRLQVGGSFVLNCLGEEDAEPTMKHFLKRFGAGADRFKVSRGTHLV